MNRILVLTRSFDHQLGGMEIHTQRVVEYLSKHGNEVTVLTAGKGVFGSSWKGAKIVRTNATPSDLLKYSFSFWKEINAFLSTNQSSYDVVLNVSMAIGGLKYEDRCLQGKHVVTILHGTYKIEKRSLLRQLKKKPAQLKGWLGLPYCLIFDHILQRVVSNSDKIVAVSEGVTSSLVAEYKVNPAQVRQLSNFVDQSRFVFRKREYSQPAKFLFLSRMHAEKGVMLLLDAISLIRQNNEDALELTFVGSGSALKAAQRIVQDRKLANVHFTGAVPSNDVARTMQDYDYFVFPTLRPEGMPLVLLEAMASGLLCVAADIGGPNELIKDGLTGLLFEPGNVESLAAAIQSAIHMRDKNRITAGALKDIGDNHNADNQMTILNNLLQPTLQKRA